MPDQVSFPQRLRDMHFRYHRALHLGEAVRPEQPAHVHKDHPGLVYVSALGFCARSAADERNGLPPVLPKQMRHEKPDALHNMALGSATQSTFQEPMLWAADSGNPPISFPNFQRWLEYIQKPGTKRYAESWAFTECSVESQDLRICGRMDAVWLDIHEKGVDGKIVEMKYRAGYKKEPKLTDLFQLVSYHLITKLQEMYLIINNNFEIYQLIDDGGGWSLITEDGSYAGLQLARETYFDELQRHLDFLDGKRTGPGMMFPNDPNSWLCGSKKGGRVIPTCPYFCHAPNVAEGQTFAYDSDGLVFEF